MSRLLITNLTIAKIREKLDFGVAEMRYCVYFKINGNEEQRCFLKFRGFYGFLSNLCLGLKYSKWRGRYVPPLEIIIAQPNMEEYIFWKVDLATVYPFTKRELDAIEKLSFEIKVIDIEEM